MVDGDVVVEPAERGEVVGVVSAAVGAVPDVVGLEPIAAGAACDHTPAVTMCHEAAYRSWDCSRSGRRDDRPATDEADDLHPACAGGSSSAAGPTLGPYSRLAPSSPPVPFASSRSTKIDTDDPPEVSTVSP